jgi:peptide/nickel transport system permease protein
MATYAEPTGGSTAVGVKPRRATWARRIAWRILGAIVVLWAVATAVFFVQQLIPGNQATLILNEQTGNQQTYTHQQLAPTEAKYGLDHSVLSQYWEYIKGLSHGDMGRSYTQFKPVTTIIGEQVGPTLVLTVTALILAWILALGTILLTSRRRKPVSTLGSGWEIFSAGLPYYWLGVILLVVFCIELKIFPVQGGTSVEGLVLPALTLAIPLAGFIGQVTRDEFEKTLDQPFVTSARARGMSDLSVRFKHVLRHSVLPAITLSGWALGALISGAVIVESVFARPGIGNMIVTAAEHRDVPLVSGVVLLVAAIYVVSNILVDIAYAIVDPRLRG